jgi:hypothetical protein
MINPIKTYTTFKVVDNILLIVLRWRRCYGQYYILHLDSDNFDLIKA